MERGNLFPVKQWQNYIEKEIGFVLPREQQQWLINAVSQTANEHNLTVEALWQRLPQDNALRQYLLDSVLIPESRFFRHLPSIQFITKAAVFADKLPATSASNEKPPFRIWSVGCAAGQEVWSLAMSLAAKSLYNYHILGTDVNQTALAQARQAEYEGRQQHLIPHDCQQFINPVQKSSQGSIASSLEVTTEPPRWQVNRILRERVDFVWHNVFTKEMPTTHLQQVIISQNMLIYFRQFDQRDILNRLATQCAVGGYLILAPGEGLGWRPKNMRRLKHVQINGWQKISP